MLALFFAVALGANPVAKVTLALLAPCHLLPHAHSPCHLAPACPHLSFELLPNVPLVPSICRTADWTNSVHHESIQHSHERASAESLELLSGEMVAMMIHLLFAAQFETTMGTFSAELYLDRVPRTASNFIGAL